VLVICGWKKVQFVAQTSSTSDLGLVAGHFGVRLGAEDVGVHEGKMRHVEKVLDHPQPRGPHGHPTAGDEAAVGLPGFGDVEDLAPGGAERGPQTAEFLAHRQGARL